MPNPSSVMLRVDARFASYLRRLAKAQGLSVVQVSRSVHADHVRHELRRSRQARYAHDRQTALRQIQLATIIAEGKAHA